MKIKKDWDCLSEKEKQILFKAREEFRKAATLTKSVWPIFKYRK